MATSALVNSAKQEFLSGVHLAADVYKLALVKAAPVTTFGASTTNAGTPGTSASSQANLGTDEVAPSGTYASGGGTLAGFSATLQGTTGCLDFTSISFTGATISATAAIIYNSSKSNKVLAVLDFGGTITSTAGTFTVTMPAVGAGTSLLRMA